MTRILKRIVLLGLFALIALAAPAGFAQAGGNDPAYQALSAGNVYVDPSLQGIDQTVLEATAVAGPLNDGNPHTRVKFAVLSALPFGWSNRFQYADSLAQRIDIGKNALIVVVAHGPGAGIAISTGAKLSADDKAALIADTTQKLRAGNDETSTIVDLGAQTVAKINMNEYGYASILWAIFLVVIIAVGSLLFVASKKRKKQMETLRGPVDALRKNVLQGIEYLDNYTDVLPKNNPDSDQVRIFRQAASTKFDQAVKIIDRATEVSDLSRAQGLLDRAQADVAQARRYLDRATGGTGDIPGDDALRPEPLPANQQAVGAIPEKQRGVSFFSSQPAPLGSLVPVTITVNGQSRQVLVTPDEADELRQGRMPQVRAFQVGGRYVPWYEYNAYDPYRDYWAYEDAGWGGFGSGLVAGFVGAELIDSLTAPAYSPYAFATDTSYYQGYADAMQNQNMGFDNTGAYGGQNDFGNNDFAGNNNDFNNADFANNNNNDFNNSDFANSNNDFSNSDFGGGGGDFGGSDFGGGDSGGGDF